MKMYMIARTSYKVRPEHMIGATLLPDAKAANTGLLI